MVPETRRQFLGGFASVLVASVAGCLDGSSDPSTDGSSTDGSSDPPEFEVVGGVTAYSTRVEVALEPSESLLSYEESEGAATDRSLPYVTSDADVEALVIDPEPPEVDEVRSFLRETEYDDATVMAIDLDVSACHRYTTMYVEPRSGGGFAPHFCHTLRDPELTCSIDETHRQLTLLRVPEPVEAVPSGHGQGRSSNCRLPPGHPGRDESPTEYRARDGGEGQ